MLIELILMVPMLYDTSYLWRRYPKFDLCHQNRYLKYDEFCKSSHADRKIADVDLAFCLPGQFNRTRAGVCLDARNQKEGKRRDEAIWRRLNYRLDLAGCGILSISTGRTKMPDEPPSPTLDRKLTTEVRCRLCPPQSNWGSGTNLHRASKCSRVSKNRKSRLAKTRRKKYNVRDS